MKQLISTLVVALFLSVTYAQDISGTYNGTLHINSVAKLRVVLHLEKSDTGYKGTMDSPDQGAKGIPVATIVQQDSLHVDIANIGAHYNGLVAGDSITGIFKQGNGQFPLVFHKGEAAAKLRPQEPKKPYPYIVEEVTFENTAAHIKLAGTLTLPSKEGKFPVVVMITGSGPQNRDEEIFEHKPFLVIADYLTRRGIAVLRYDDRGVGQSTGNFGAASSLDFASDVKSAIAYLKTRKDIKQIGLIGHSEGGIIAPIVAANNKDVSFIVLLAGTGIKGSELFLRQLELVAHVNGQPDEDIMKNLKDRKEMYDIVDQNKDTAKLRAALTGYYGRFGDANTDKVRALVNDGMKPWGLFILRYDPTDTLKMTHCPVLALNGEKDVQVPSQINLSSIEKSLKAGGNKDVTIKEYKGLNHLFQECTTGSPLEYNNIEQTISPQVLEDMGNWILLKTK